MYQYQSMDLSKALDMFSVSLNQLTLSHLETKYLLFMSKLLERNASLEDQFDLDKAFELLKNNIPKLYNNHLKILLFFVVAGTVFLLSRGSAR